MSTTPPLPDSTLSAVVASLRPLQSLQGALRGLPMDPDRVQCSPTDATASDGASDAGVLSRARVLSRRLGQIPAPHRVTLEWLVTYSHAGTAPSVLAGMLGRAAAPIELRERVDLAEARLRAAQSFEAQLGREAQHAHERLRHGVQLGSDGSVKSRHDAARARVEQSTGARDQAERALAAWGYQRIVGACVAWLSPDRGCAQQSLQAA